MLNQHKSEDVLFNNNNNNEANFEEESLDNDENYDPMCDFWLIV